MFSFQDLLAQCPSGSIVDDPTDGVIIKVGALIGETVDDMSSTKIVEFVGKLLSYCRNTQIIYNANGGTPLPAAQQVTSFAAPTNSTVQTEASGAEMIVRTQTMTSRIRLDNTEIFANLATV